MKKKLITLLLFFAAITIHAQYNCVTWDEPLFGMPDELNRGRLKLEGMRGDNPYTLMDRRMYPNANDGFIAIRTKLQDPTNEVLRITLYKTVYNFAIKPMPGSGGNWDSHYSELATWAKFNAFIFVIGLHPDSNFRPLDEIDTTGLLRDSFAIRAMHAFSKMDYRCPNPPWDGFYAPVQLSIFRCRELQQYLEAYDWLKGANADPDLAGRCPIPPGDKDRNSGSCTPRYRLRLFARNFYKAVKGVAGPIECPTGWKRNHGIMAAAAIGMAGIVLHDAGVETGYLDGLFDWVQPAPDFSPVKWFVLGLESYENILEGKHILAFDDAPMCNDVGTTGYAEGPAYYNYAFSCMIPFLRAQDNFSSVGDLLTETNENAYTFASYRQPFYERSPFLGLFKWQEQVTTGEVMPSYDNSGNSPGSLLGLTGNVGFKYGNSFSSDVNTQLYPDYIAMMATPNAVLKEEVVTRPSSGNTYIRKKDKIGSNHFFHMLHETGMAVDKPTGPGGGVHEDEDFGNFSLYAQHEQLALDPLYFGASEKDKTNKDWHHNVIRVKVDPNETFLGHELSDPVVNISNNGFSFSYHNKTTLYTGTNHVYEFDMKRQVTTFTLANGELYYLLNDYAPTAKGITWRLNGSGLAALGSYSYNTTTRMSDWSFPCQPEHKQYRLLHFYAALGGGTYPVSYHAEEDNCLGITASNKLTRLILTQDNPNTIIQSLLIPHICSADLPKVTYDEQTDYVATTIESVVHEAKAGKRLIPPGTPGATVYDTLRTTHIAQVANLPLTIPDPFKTGNTADVLTTDAQHATLSNSTHEISSLGPCGNYAMKFKEAVINSGSYLAFNDTDYIRAIINVNANFKFVSKFKYEAYADLNGYTSTGINISFYLPDHEIGYMMAAKIGSQVLPCTYNDTTGVLVVTIFSPTTFTIELANPCAADCFFPPTNEPIDTFAVFNTGTTEVLGHDLDIIQTGGELHITKGSKMSICPDYMFRNQDSLILYAEDVDSNYVYQNPMDGPSTISTPVRNRMASGRSMIIVNDKAALVLDSGSFTHVGDNSTILVLKGGTLLVRKNAILEIGGKESTNPKRYGEVIAEEGAFVCIEDSSSIYFYADTPAADTQDVNVFYVSINPHTPTVAGTNSLGARGRFIPLSSDGEPPVSPFQGEYANTTCIPFCDLKLHHPPHGVNNRDFGWCNFSEPVAAIHLPDFVCAGSIIQLRDNHVLNETDYLLEVYSDTGMIIQKESTPDSVRFCTMDLPPLPAGDHYHIKLYIANDCGERDTLLKTISSYSVPVPAFSLDDTGCPGTGNIIADGSASIGSGPVIPHIWYVQVLDTLKIDDLKILTNGDESMEWVNDTALAVDSVFDFPGWTWEGGYSYVVGLIINGPCGDSIITDTIHFPLDASISIITKPGVYNNPLGPSALQLNGTVAGATSWSWSPATYLSDSTVLNPVATPTGPITYVLTATSGSCIASDTINILYKNHFAYAGANRVVCTPDTVTLGTGYMLAAFMAAAHISHHGYPSYIDLQVAASTDAAGLSRTMTELYSDKSVVDVCSTLETLLIDERFLDKVIEHPGFASFYEAFMLNPMSTTTYASFPYEIASFNVLGSSTCLSAYMEELYNLYQGRACSTYYQYPDFSPEAALLLGAMYVLHPNPTDFINRWNSTKTDFHAIPAFMGSFIANGGHMETSCDFSVLLNNPNLDDVYYSHADFQAYMDSLLYGQGDDIGNTMQLFIDFIMLEEGPTQDYINALSLSSECFNEFMNGYEFYLETNTCISPKHIVWEKKDVATWQHLADWNESYNMYDAPTQNTQYRITVLDLFNNTVEYDIADITVDTVLSAMFAVSYQTDSTMYFTSYTFLSDPSATGYLWVFGDGDSSTATNPVHTFPAFDSSYVVCLYATNQCGTSQYCDTIMVDSTMLYFFEAGKKGNDNEPFKWNEPKEKHDLSRVNRKTSVLSNRNILGNNRPNPFDGVTEIDYELVPGYKTAELIVINILGQTVSRINIPTVKGTIRYSRATLQDGMYFYSLMVDGIKAGNKIMVVK